MRAKSYILAISCFMTVGCIYWNYPKKVKLPNLYKGQLSKTNETAQFKRFERNKNDEPALHQWMQEKMEMKYLTMKERIEYVCKKYHLWRRRKLVYKESLAVDTHYKVALCSHPKAGSTTWRFHYKNFLSNETVNKLRKQYGKDFLNLKRVMNKKFWRITENDIRGSSGDMINPHTLNKFLKNKEILSFSFVRHPFERLVSAYKDRVIDINAEKHHFIENNGIQKWFHQDHSFPAFVDLVLSQYRQSCFSDQSQTSSMHQDESYDSQCEREINEHWQPFASRCSFCDIDYDLIGQMETWSEDFNYIVRKNKLENILKLENDTSKKYHPTKGDTQQMTKKYFSKISKKQGEDLYKMYRMDFQMFQYDPNPYLQLTKKLI